MVDCRIAPFEGRHRHLALCVAVSRLACHLHLIAACALCAPGEHSHAAETLAADVLTDAQWIKVNRSVDAGLHWLAAQQRPDGSFPTLDLGQPGVTSLCVLAFMSHGHFPGEGPHGDRLRRAIDFVLSCQKRNGLLALSAPDSARLSRSVPYTIGSAATYNHALSGLMLTESYAMQGEELARRMRPAIELSLDATLEMQTWPKDNPADKGGWRYVTDFDAEDSDLSATGWHLMFLRSAKNAGFDVPKEPIDDAVDYIRRTYNPRSGTFRYGLSSAYWTYQSRGMTGAGILALSHAGLHGTPEARAAGDWLLEHRFDQYNHRPDPLERYHYGLLISCQAMYQLGEQHWREFFPSTATTIVANQRPDGSWPQESHHRDYVYGNAYTTAVCLIALGTPNELLPIFQR